MVLDYKKEHKDDLARDMKKWYITQDSREYMTIMASVAHLSERAPFTSANVGSIPVGNDL